MLNKIICEVCGIDDKTILEKHHIIERTEIDTSNNDYNLAVICSNCHSKHHFGNLEIIGFISSTKRPYGRTLIYKLIDILNIEGMEDFVIRIKPKQTKIRKE